MNIFLILSICFLCPKKGLSDLALRFQKDSEPTINSTAIKTMDPSLYDAKNIKSLSFSLWVKVDYFRIRTSVFSYSISDIHSNQMGLALSHNYAKVLMRENQNGERGREYRQDEWYHMAGVFEEGTYSEFFVNGELDHTANQTTNGMHLNGTFVLGQEQDSYIGGFQAFQSFSGWISHFNIYNRTLTSEEIQVLSNCKTAGDIPGDILPWNVTDWELSGAVEEEEVDLCGNDRLPFTMIAEPFTREESQLMCKKAFWANMYLPQTEEENEVLYNATIPFAETCRSPFHRTAYTWLGGCRIRNTENFTDFERNPLNWTNLIEGVSRMGTGCLALQEGAYAQEWTSVGTQYLYKLCPTCSSASKHLTMRGLCEEHDPHTMFFPTRNTQEKLSFKGFTRFNIVFDEEQEAWLLNDIWSNETLAKLFAQDGSYPLGTKEWDVVKGYRICNLPAEKKTNLSFANCKEGEFNCDDGTCILIDKRCDLRTDCSDYSDEDHCDKLEKNEHYQSHLLPTGPSRGPLKVNLSVTITNILDVDVRSMKSVLDLIVSVSWFDLRIYYRNLKNISDYNVIPKNEIWTPDLEYLNIASKDFYSSSPSLRVIKLGIPADDAISRVKSDELFYGNENHLNISWKISVPLYCDMQLFAFPFDRQNCALKIKLESSRAELIQWDHVISKYTGPTQLTEYEVGPLVSSVETDAFGYSIGDTTISLSRRYSYYITTTFVPTYMLVLISYMSFFCKTEHVDLRVMMTITTLLVLYSLYQQIENSLPKTAYTKAIDIWCFYCLTIIMTQVIFHVVLELNFKGKFRMFRKETKDSSSSENLAEGEDEETAQIKKNMLRAGRLVYGIVQFLFALVYIIVACTNSW